MNSRLFNDVCDYRTEKDINVFSTMKLALNNGLTTIWLKIDIRIGHQASVRE